MAMNRQFQYIYIYIFWLRMPQLISKKRAPTGNATCMMEHSEPWGYEISPYWSSSKEPALKTKNCNEKPVVIAKRKMDFRRCSSLAIPPAWQKSQNPPRPKKSQESIRVSLRGAPAPNSHRESKTSLRGQKFSELAGSGPIPKNRI